MARPLWRMKVRVRPGRGAPGWSKTVMKIGWWVGGGEGCWDGLSW